MNVVNEKMDYDVEIIQQNGTDYYVLYHVTQARFTESILKKGLIPLIGPLSAKCEESTAAIYCFPSIIASDDALYGWLGNEYDDLEDELGQEIDLIRLKLTIPVSDYLLDSTVPYEVAINKIIPPEYIEIESNAL